MVDEIKNAEDESFLDSMYGDNEETNAYIKSLNDENSKKEVTTKIVGKDSVEFKDSNGNKIVMPSEKYIGRLEERIDRLEEVVRIQSKQLTMLGNKYLKSQETIAGIQHMLGIFGEIGGNSGS